MNYKEIFDANFIKHDNQLLNLLKMTLNPFEINNLKKDQDINSFNKGYFQYTDALDSLISKEFSDVKVYFSLNNINYTDIKVKVHEILLYFKNEYKSIGYVIVKNETEIEDVVILNINNKIDNLRQTFKKNFGYSKKDFKKLMYTLETIVISNEE